MVAPGVPARVRVDPRLQDDAELAHGCRQRPFLGCPARHAPLREDVEHRVTACGRARRPGQDRADLGPPAAHLARAGPLATSIVAWGHPDQRRDVAVVEHPSRRPRRWQGG